MLSTSTKKRTRRITKPQREDSLASRVNKLQGELNLVEREPEDFRNNHSLISQNPRWAYQLGKPGEILSTLWLNGNVAKILIRNVAQLNRIEDVRDAAETVLAHIQRFQQHQHERQPLPFPEEIYLETTNRKMDRILLEEFTDELLDGVSELKGKNYDYEIENNSEPYIKLKLQKLSNIWRGWEPQLAQLDEAAEKTARNAKFGMSLVDFLRERTGVKVRIGGSLSAAMFGGQRKPKDIDIDIPDAKKVTDSRETYGEIVKSQLKPGKALITGKDLFLIKSISNTSSGVKVEFWHKVTPKPLDTFDDYDEIEGIVKGLKREDTPLHEVNVDFSTEFIFEASGLIVDSKGNRYGYYGPEFLIAAYLNRLASKSAKKEEDDKEDRSQIMSLLSYYLKQRSGQETSVDEKKKFLSDLKKSVIYKHIQENHRLSSVIDALFDDIIKEMIKGN